MAKTLFGPGVIVTSQWLNGARELKFDGADKDWHFAPINRNDIQRGGVNGLDRVYVTLDTDQSYGVAPITGRKSFMGEVQFGDQTNANPSYSPLFWTTNAKYNQGGRIRTSSSNTPNSKRPTSSQSRSSPKESITSPQ